MKKLFSHDPDTGITQWFIPEDDGRKFIIQTTQDVTPFVEANKKAYANFDERSNWKGEWHHVATIPLHTFFEMKKKGITESNQKFKRWLNDPDHKYFRTRPGRV